jgi:hypothetical protein
VSLAAGQRAVPSCSIHPQTFLVDDLVGGRLPLGLGEDLNGDDVAVHRTVHALAPDEEDGLGERGHAHGALEVVVRARAEVALVERAGLDARGESGRREVL